MSIAINISYTDEAEKDKVMELLRPILKSAKIKKNEDKKPYKKIYINT